MEGRKAVGMGIAGSLALAFISVAGIVVKKKR